MYGLREKEVCCIQRQLLQHLLSSYLLSQVLFVQLLPQQYQPNELKQTLQKAKNILKNN